ncbi:NAD(P)-dependent oxidoreductase [Ekhidna sp.]|uniref:NAD(P)-dependent oxidoreductase n=1 Tax=Ekhidna sp. TaxID=2608089 RepID=UPI003CCC3985
MKILIYEEENFDKAVIEFLENYGTVDVGFKGLPIKEIFERYEVFYFRLGIQIRPEHFSSSSIIKIIATPVTGLDHIDLDACEKAGVKVISLKGHTEFLKSIKATAEHTIALTFSLLRKIPFAFDDVKSGSWLRDNFIGQELHEKKVGILGLGRLGKIVGEYFLAFGCEVSFFDPREDIPAEWEDKRVNDLERFLKPLDILSIHVDFNDKNFEMIDAKFLSYLPSKCVIINTSRGQLINEIDLLAALSNKTISGAALDVVQNEYDFSKDNLLVKYAKEATNLIITPHIGGKTYESMRKTEMYIAKLIVAEL